MSAIDYSAESGLLYPKARARVLDRIDRKRELKRLEDACRKAVKARDKGRCRVDGCKSAAVHLHHVQFRSQLGKWTTGNILSLCVQHHQFVHAGLLEITGDADETLTFKGKP